MSRVEHKDITVDDSDLETKLEELGNEGFAGFFAERTEDKWRVLLWRPVEDAGIEDQLRELINQCDDARAAATLEAALGMIQKALGEMSSNS